YTLIRIICTVVAAYINPRSWKTKIRGIVHWCICWNGRVVISGLTLGMKFDLLPPASFGAPKVGTRAATLWIHTGTKPDSPGPLDLSIPSPG
ncbi:hypothetical protein MKW98_028543, partial [Papaver atlanticum]